MTEEVTGPAWGYRRGEARIFDDGVLPAGWVDSPAKVKGKAAEGKSEGEEKAEGGAE